MKKINRFCSALCAVTIILSGCGHSGKVTQSENEKKNTAGAINNYGAVITVADIKQAYNETDESIMPLYNVAPDETFDIPFSFSQEELLYSNVYQFVTVHTSADCKDESLVYTTNDQNISSDGKVSIEVTSCGGVMSTDSESDNMIENHIETWGNAPMYYLAIWYDMDSDKIVKLDSPIVIPFTVKHEVQAPNVKAVIDSTGRLKLDWEDIEGATEYRIYNLLGNGQSTGIRNEPVKGAEYGYSDSLIFDSTTTESEFDCFSGNDSHSLAIHDRSVSDKTYVIGQNFNVCGEYYVSAVVNGKESGLSNSVSTTDMKLPYVLTDDNDIMFQNFEDSSKLPLSVDVLNIDGSVTKRNVLYTFQWEETYEGTKTPEYRYKIEGTAITGCVGVDFSDNGEYEQTVGEQSASGNCEPENNLDKTPDADLPTITNSDGSTDSQTDKTLVEEQQENTKAHVEKGNEDKVDNPKNAQVFADSAEEEWIALNLVNGESKISVEAFPKLQNADYLEDVFYKTYYQNPYIIGLQSFEYDYKAMTLNVNYFYDQKTIEQKQAQINENAQGIVSQVITEDMDSDDKELALYSYIVDNVKYDSEALEEAEEKAFVKTADFQHEDSYNSYGAIVNKSGVCQSFAYAYKLLCQMSGVNCVVVTGNLNGNLPHAWNAVSINDKWYQVDTTNNVNTTGIEYFLYNSDTNTANETGYTTDSYFELDSVISDYVTDDDSLEYYYSNGLTADSMDIYSQILDDKLNDKTKSITVRYTQDDFDTQTLVSTVQLVFNKHGMEDKLEALGSFVNNGYIVIVIN